MITRSLASLGPHGFHRLVYHEWKGPVGAPTAVCAHGLTRNGRDFDALAAALQRRYRVICPDIVGRGGSDWLTEPADYATPLYLADMAALIARLDTDEVVWIGTSMGGLIGMTLAAQAGTPIRRLVLNDIGGRVAAKGLRRIASYVGADATFANLAEFEIYQREIAATFGPLTDAQWDHLAKHGVRHRPDGRLECNYDHNIAVGFRGISDDVDLWSIWDAVRCPTLLLRGAASDVLDHKDAVAMTARGPKARLVEFAGVGHAPALMSADQIAAIEGFLEEHERSPNPDHRA